MTNLPRLTKDSDSFGPCMLALTSAQQNFVSAILSQGDVNYTRAYSIAYPNAGPNTCNVNGPRLAHDERILDAIQEESRRRMRAGLALGVSKMVEIAGNDMHKDQYKACVALMNRSGLHELTEHKVTVARPTDDIEIKQRIALLAKELGLDPAKLLGLNAVPALPPPVDAEFEVIESSTEGLEDVL